MKQSFKIFALLIVITLGLECSSQSIQNYSIVYDKKVNISKLYPRWNVYDKEDKYHKEKFELVTNSEVSIYNRLEKDISEERDELYSYMAYSNTYIDIKKNQQISQKEVGEKTFLLNDTIAKLQWFLHDETRDILGYSCKKAMAKYADSIVIVAYYSDQLEAPIGPESIGGLPGTILGMVIPKLHTTWLASSVQSLELKPEKKIEPPKKGELVKSKELYDLVKKVYKEYNNAYSIIYRVIL